MQVQACSPTALEGSRVNCGRSDAASARSEDVTNRSHHLAVGPWNRGLAVGVRERGVVHMTGAVRKSWTSRAARMVGGVVVGVGVWILVALVMYFTPVLWLFGPALASLTCVAGGAWGYRTYEKDDVAVGFMLVGLLGFVVVSSL